jgi:hypothetical protein
MPLTSLRARGRFLAENEGFVKEFLRSLRTAASQRDSDVVASTIPELVPTLSAAFKRWAADREKIALDDLKAEMKAYDVGHGGVALLLRGP